MKKLVIGCAVAGFIALSAKSEARLSASVATPRVSPVPKEQPQIGVASWYGLEFQGYTTANGEVFDMNGLTAAHPTLPFGTTIRVTNLKNRKYVVLRINDRGPYIGQRMLDVSWAAADRLGFVNSGTTPVHVEVVTYPKRYLPQSIAKAPY
jgi:rare lipoprotein A